MLKLGIIGMSEGNGHPYSWSAIFNGYTQKYMRECPFPVIPDYLNAENFPSAAIPNATVTHIWTENKLESQHIARSANILYISNSIEELCDNVDAVLLARDDAERHYEMALPILKKGLPIFIDKPLAYTLDEADKIWQSQNYEDQIFTCSSLRFAQEFNPTIQDLQSLGEIKFVSGIVPKSWLKYAVHIIEPALGLIPLRGKLVEVSKSINKRVHSVDVVWSSGIEASFRTMGDVKAPLTITIYGNNGFKEFKFVNTFFAFKKSLEKFIQVVNKEESNIPKAYTREVIEIIEKGNS